MSEFLHCGLVVEEQCLDILVLNIRAGVGVIILDDIVDLEAGGTENVAQLQELVRLAGQLKKELKLRLQTLLLKGISNSPTE